MLTRFRPFHDIARFNREFGRFHHENAGNDEVTKFTPAVDIEETEDAIILSADLPGVDENDIDISVHQGVLILTGKREGNLDEETESSIYRERRHGSFFRQFRLGSKVDVDSIVAAYKNGVLTVTLPKKEEAKPKQIKVAIS